MKWLNDHPEILLPLLIVLIFLPHLGILPVNIMEARNFITAREMWTEGNWLHTTLNGLPRYEKPPLPTWLTALSGILFGFEKVWAMRLPAVLVMGLLLIYAWKFCYENAKDKEFAGISAILIATSFFMTWAGRNGQWDIFTHGFMMVSVYYIYRWLHHPQKQRRAAFLAGIFFGFSFLSKGPVSVYALLLPFLISRFWVYRSDFSGPIRWKEMLYRTALFALPALLISGTWHGYIHQTDTSTLREITSREVTNWNNYNVRPFYYYWDFFVQSGIWTIPSLAGLMYFHVRTKVGNRKLYTFTFLWVISSVVLLSLIPEKKSRYLLPVLIPLGMNTALYFQYLFKSRIREMRLVERCLLFLHHGLITIITLGVAVGGYLYLGERLTSVLIWYILLSVSGLLIGLWLLRSLLRHDMQRFFYGTAIFMISVIVFGLPISKAIMYNPGYKDLSHLRQWEDSSGIPSFVYKELEPEMVWSYGKTIPILDPEDLTTVSPSRTIAVLVSEKDQNEFLVKTEKQKTEQIHVYNMSQHEKGKKGFNPRLFRYLYLVHSNSEN